MLKNGFLGWRFWQVCRVFVERVVGVVFGCGGLGCGVFGCGGLGGDISGSF